MNGIAFPSQGDTGSEPVGVPLDLAERTGAVRLMRLALESVQGVELPAKHFKASPEDAMYSFPIVLTAISYALARGVGAGVKLEACILSQPDFRHLCSGRGIDSRTLTAFLELHRGLVRDVLTRIFVGATGHPASVISAQVEARLTRASGLELPLAA